MGARLESASLGIAVQLLVAVIGIGGLISFIAVTFDLLRWVAAAYLAYIGIKVWRNANERRVAMKPLNHARESVVPCIGGS